MSRDTAMLDVESELDLPRAWRAAAHRPFAPLRADGSRIPDKTIWNHIVSGKIPSTKIGGRVYVKDLDLIAFFYPDKSGPKTAGRTPGESKRAHRRALATLEADGI